MISWLRSAWDFLSRTRKRNAAASEADDGIFVTANGHPPSETPPNFNFAAQPPPSKRPRLQPTTSPAENYVKGLASWSSQSQRHVLRRRRGKARAHNSRLHTSLVYPEQPSSPTGLLGFVRDAMNSSDVGPVVDLTDDGDVTSDGADDDVVLLSPQPGRFAVRPSASEADGPSTSALSNGPITVSILDDDIEIEEPSPRTPDSELRRKPLTRAQRSPVSVASPALRNGIDLAERDRFRLLLKNQSYFDPAAHKSSHSGQMLEQQQNSREPRGSVPPSGPQQPQKIMRAMSELRGVLDELCPEGPSTAASQPSPADDPSLITLDDSPMATPSAGPSPPPTTSRNESLTRLEHSFDLDPTAICANMQAWRRDHLGPRNVEAGNLDRELALLAELRFNKNRLAEIQIRDRMRLQGFIIPDLDEEEEEAQPLPPLPEDADGRIAKALGAPANVTLAEVNGVPISSRDLRTLGGLNWLNDEVVNFYLSLVAERGAEEGRLSVHAFSTFFYPKLMSGGHAALRRWTKRINVFAKDLLLVPVHLGVHWCMAVVDIANKAIEYYDSMGGPNDAALDALRDYVEAEHLDKKKSPLDTSDWELVTRDDIPHQQNGSDCGMFACKFAEYAAAARSINFTQEDMPYFRKRMIYEIVTKKLLD